ncbi:MAG: hypothetical protein H8E44_02270 [Planctomycetes bacterium]|nr:hypothetical protein [Planctomycetota bacterium]
MKIAISLLILTIVSGIAGPRSLADVPRDTPGKPIKHEVHDGYFVSNKFEPKSPASFVIIQNRKRFDTVFGVAFVMGDKSNRLKPDAFKSRMVIGAIKRGPAHSTYKVASVTVQKSTLYLSYEAKSGVPGSATFACPLIVSVPKGKYAAVVFVENEKPVKTVALK